MISHNPTPNIERKTKTQRTRAWAGREDPEVSSPLPLALFVRS